DPVITRCLTVIAEAEAAAENVKQFSARGNEEPALKGHLAARDAARATMIARQAKLRSEFEEQLRGKARAEAEAGAAQVQARIALLKDLEEQLGNSIQIGEKDSAVINKESIDLDAMKE